MSVAVVLLSGWLWDECVIFVRNCVTQLTVLALLVVVSITVIRVRLLCSVFRLGYMMLLGKRCSFSGCERVGKVPRTTRRNSVRSLTGPLTKLLVLVVRVVALPFGLFDTFSRIGMCGLSVVTWVTRLVLPLLGRFTLTTSIVG